MSDPFVVIMNNKISLNHQGMSSSVSLSRHVLHFRYQDISYAMSLLRYFLCYVVTKAFPHLFRYQGMSSTVSLSRYFLCYVVTKAFPLLCRYQGVSSVISLPKYFLCYFVTKAFPMLCRYQGMSSEVKIKNYKLLLVVIFNLFYYSSFRYREKLFYLQK